MNRPTTTAIVVTYNSRASAGACFAALYTAHDAGLLDCVVVDNASSDGTAAWIAREHPWVRCIALDENLGFGRACNRAAAEVETASLLLVNPDAVMAPDAIRTLLGFLEVHPQAALAAPALREPDGGLQHAGGLPTPLAVLREAWGGTDAARRPVRPGDAPFATDWLCGAVLAIRASVWRELGGFDPRFFLYFEETDLCRRARDAGWELWAVGESVGEHRNAASAESARAPMVHGCIAEHYFRSRFYYLGKHHGRGRALLVEIGELALLAARALYARARGRSAGFFAVRVRAPIARVPDETPLRRLPAGTAAP